MRRTAAPAGAEPIDLTAAQVTSFDPPPGGGDEQPGAVPNAFDDDLTSAWSTERYETAALGGLKTGVGLLVDLEVEAPSAEAARADVERMCGELLANPLIESFEIEVQPT